MAVLLLPRVFIRVVHSGVAGDSVTGPSGVHLVVLAVVPGVHGSGRSSGPGRISPSERQSAYGSGEDYNVDDYIGEGNVLLYVSYDDKVGGELANTCLNELAVDLCN